MAWLDLGLVLACGISVWALFLPIELRILAFLGIGLIALRMLVFAGMLAAPTRLQRRLEGVFGSESGTVASHSPQVGAVGLDPDPIEGRVTDRFDRNWIYPLFLGVGIVGLVLLVMSTGGPARSPFAQVLAATFILGQVRAPTAKGVWGLWAAGVATVGVSEPGFRLLEGWLLATAVASLEIPGHAFILPGLVVGAAASWVNAARLKGR